MDSYFQVGERSSMGILSHRTKAILLILAILVAFPLFSASFSYGVTSEEDLTSNTPMILSSFLTDDKFDNLNSFIPRYASLADSDQFSASLSNAYQTGKQNALLTSSLSSSYQPMQSRCTSCYSPNKVYPEVTDENEKVISLKLETVLSQSDEDSLIRVIITLKSQPQWLGVNSIKSQAQQRIQTLGQICESDSLEYLEMVDKEIHQMRLELYLSALSKVAPTQDQLISEITLLGGQIIHTYAFMNCVAVKMTPNAIRSLEKHPNIQSIVFDELSEIQLDFSSPSIYSSVWHSNGYDGAPWDVAVLDTGIDSTHPALSTRVIAAQSFVSSSPDPDDYVGHGTHVAGIIASTDPLFTGIAPGVSIINAKVGRDSDGYAYDTDVIAAAEWSVIGTPDGAEIINHSYGMSSEYKKNVIDALVDYYDIIWVGAAGNDGPGSGTVENVGYNMITVGNMDDRDTISRSDDLIYSSSSRGPTSDGRMKPDIVAPGAGIVSAAYDWEGNFGLNPDWVMKWGTSMAAPHVAGAVALLYDYRGTDETLYYKALLMQTANDYGTTGPDNTYGWGYLNLADAYNNRDNVFMGSIQHSESNWYKVYLTAGTQFKATLVFERQGVYYPTTNSYSMSPVSDLDLRFYAPDGSLIFSSSGGVNNVEQIRTSSAPMTGWYRVEVYGYYIDASVSTEFYALATGPGTSEAYEPIISDVSVDGASVSNWAYDGSYYREEPMNIEVMVSDSDTPPLDMTVTLDYYLPNGTYGGSLSLPYNASAGLWEGSPRFTQIAEAGVYRMVFSAIDECGLTSPNHNIYITCLNEVPVIHWFSISSPSFRRVNETLDFEVNATDFHDLYNLNLFVNVTKSDASTDLYPMLQHPSTNLFYLNLTLPGTEPLGIWAFSISAYDQEGGLSVNSSTFEVLSDQYLLTVISPYGTPTGAGWYDAGQVAYARLDIGSIPVSSDERIAFQMWSDGASGTDYSQSAPIIMNRAKTATAVWTTQYYITIQSDHGSTTTSTWAYSGEDFEVSLGSFADVVSDTSRWRCTGYRVDGGTFVESSTCILTSVSAPHTITFEWIQQFHLTVSTSPTGLTPTPTITPTGDWFDTGTSITLTAQTIPGYTFQYWLLDNVNQTSGLNSIIVTMNDAHVAVAQYEAIPTPLSGIPWLPIVAVIIVTAVAIGVGIYIFYQRRKP